MIKVQKIGNTKAIPMSNHIHYMHFNGALDVGVCHIIFVI